MTELLQHRVLEPSALAAAAAGRARDERLDPLLPGARDDDGGDLRGHRRRRRALAEEYNRLVADANGLIDALNWARW